MKRITLILVICLVMCFSMAFPASAQIVLNESKFVSRAIIEEISEQVKPIIPASCLYRLVLYCYNVTIGNYGLYVIYSNTPVVSLSSVIYMGYYLQGDKNLQVSKRTFGSVTYTSGSYITFTLARDSNYAATNLNVYGIITDYSTATFENQANMFSSALARGYDLDLCFTPTVDTTALQSLLSTAKSITNTGYTGTSWQALQTAITNAENLLNTTGYTQEQVDNARNNLQSVLDGLTMLPPTTELRALLVEADAITDIGYTPPTWNRFTTARSNGHALIASTNYTAPQVTATTTELRSSMNGLTLVQVEPPTPPQPPRQLGYDLATGDVSGYFSRVPDIFYVYCLPVLPIAVGLFAIIFSIKIIPHVFGLIISKLKR